MPEKLPSLWMKKAHNSKLLRKIWTTNHNFSNNPMPNALPETLKEMVQSQYWLMAKLTCVKVNQLFGMLLKSTKKLVTTSFQKITCKDSKWESSSMNSQRSSHPSNQDILTGQRKLNNKKKNKDKKSKNSLKSWMKS